MLSWKAKAVNALLSLLKFLYNLPVIGPYLDLLSLTITAFSRFGAGGAVAGNLENCKRPAKMLKLYQYEGCPYCRKVRETLSMLDLDVIIYPCPRETFARSGFMAESRYRLNAEKLGGKVQFPLLVDESESESAPKTLYESDAINEYLWETYGDKATKPILYSLGSSYASFVLMCITSILRSFPEYGLIRIPSKKPDQMLELYGFESSPFCKRVRERLDSLEIPYVSRNIAHGSPKRAAFKEKYGETLSTFRKKAGMICVPFLIDPNTQKEMFESEDIKQYLISTYQDGEFVTTESIATFFDSKKDD